MDIIDIFVTISGILPILIILLSFLFRKIPKFFIDTYLLKYIENKGIIDKLTLELKLKNYVNKDELKESHEKELVHIFVSKEELKKIPKTENIKEIFVSKEYLNTVINKSTRLLNNLNSKIDLHISEMRGFNLDTFVKKEICKEHKKEIKKVLDELKTYKNKQEGYKKALKEQRSLKNKEKENN